MGGDCRTEDACGIMWEDRFAAEDGYLFGRELSGVLAANPWLALPSQSVLCAADGEGRNAVHLARHGMNVTAFDMSATAVGRAAALAKESGVEVQTHVSEWSHWDWTQQFDMVVGIFIQFVGQQQRAKQFSDMTRALRTGGGLCCMDIAPNRSGAAPVARPRQRICIHKQNCMRSLPAGS